MPEKLSESQSGRAAQPTHPAGQKKKLIRRPKGSDWCLQDEIGLANDRPKYDRIIVRVLPLTVNVTNPQHASGR